MSKLLIFELKGEYGHFRKFNTTSSPLTYAIPTRTALAGILGAVLGIERETGPGIYSKDAVSVNELFGSDRCSFAIQILRPVSKTRVAFNLVNTAKSFFNIENRTQIQYELLKNPAYRIFLNHDDLSVHNELLQRLQERNHHFTPYLGLAQFTASIEACCEHPYEKIELNKAHIRCSSVVNLSMLQHEQAVRFGDGRYSIDTMPMVMDRNRLVSVYSDVMCELRGGEIEVAVSKYVKTSFGNIVYL